MGRRLELASELGADGRRGAMAAITISRQLGSGGATIARTIAEELGYHLLDRELVDLVAKETSSTPEKARLLDEHDYSWATSIAMSVLQAFQARAPITQETYNFVSARVIREAAQRESVVILGRAAQVVLGKVPGTFHVHVVAAPEVRVVRIAERDGVSHDEALRRIHESDRDRSRHVSSVGQRDWEDPLLYDLILNTDRLSPTAAAGVVVTAARLAGVVK
jgi:cytidylate kinase